jgi:PAS domain S-box-containing protein
MGMNDRGEASVAPPDALADDQQFRELADFAPVMIWRSGTDMLCDWFNKPWLEHTGRTMEEEVGDGWTELVHPDDYDHCLGIYVEAFNERRRFTMEYRLLRHDGQYRWLLDNGAPFHRGGEFAGYFGSCIDITSHRLAEEAQVRLIHELDHRVKNTLSVVQALARQSFRSLQATPQLEAFDARVLALARAHDIITRSTWGVISFRALLDEVTRPWCTPSQAFRFEGPDINVLPKVAVTLSIALHELCTNALKYGALSVPQGRVDVDWSIEGGDAPRFSLTWRESGGPPVVAPAPDAMGQGSRMLQRTLAPELDGEVELRFDPSGFRCDVRAPLESLGKAG